MAFVITGDGKAFDNEKCKARVTNSEKEALVTKSDEEELFGNRDGKAIVIRMMGRW